MKACPYHLQTDRVACMGAGRPYMPSLGEIATYCCNGGHTRCPIYGVDSGGIPRQYRSGAYWVVERDRTI